MCGLGAYFERAFMSDERDQSLLRLSIDSFFEDGSCSTITGTGGTSQIQIFILLCESQVWCVERGGLVRATSNEQRTRPEFVAPEYNLILWRRELISHHGYKGRIPNPNLHTVVSNLDFMCGA